MKQCDESVRVTTFNDAVTLAAVPDPSPDPTLPPPFTETFYVDTYVDAQALVEHRFSPRNKRTFGPIRTYADAVQWPKVMRPESTHYEVRKVYVRTALIKWLPGPFDDFPFAKITLGSDDPHYVLEDRKPGEMVD